MTTGDAPGAKRPPPSTLAPRFVLGAFALAGLGMLGIYLSLRPDGDPVGAIDLLDPAATLTIDGAAGDSLTFQSRVTTSLRSYEGDSWKQRSNAMKTSMVTLTVVAPDGTEQASRCELWEGSMGSDRPDDDHLTENDVINDCQVVLKTSGKHVVRVRAEWTHSLAIKAARITVFNERGG